MNYASDPFWAYKDTYGPEQRQAYENQVMIDRAARDQHRAEFDAAATISSALLLGSAWSQRRAAKKAAKAREDWIRTHYPTNYEARAAEYSEALSALATETRRQIDHLQYDINAIKARLRSAHGRSARSLTAQLEALQARIEDKRLAQSQAKESLAMKYRDIVEYERGLAAF